MEFKEKIKNLGLEIILEWVFYNSDMIFTSEASLPNKRDGRCESSECSRTRILGVDFGSIFQDR